MRKRAATLVALMLAAFLLVASPVVRDSLQAISRMTETEAPESSVTVATAPREKQPNPPEPPQQSRSSSPPVGEGVGHKTIERDDLVGDFCFPEDVPHFKISSSKEAGNDLARVLEIVVDTRASSEVDLTRISRTLKAFHADRDALVISFKDVSARGAPATGEAYVINTVVGALILGMSDGPPNQEGLLVVSYKDEPTVPQDEVFARTECSRTSTMRP